VYICNNEHVYSPRRQKYVINTATTLETLNAKIQRINNTQNHMKFTYQWPINTDSDRDLAYVYLQVSHTNASGALLPRPTHTV